MSVMRVLRVRVAVSMAIVTIVLMMIMVVMAVLVFVCVGTMPTRADRRAATGCTRTCLLFCCCWLAARGRFLDLSTFRSTAARCVNLLLTKR